MKLSGGSLTGDIVMNGNKITGLDTNYPPRINNQATSWSQVRKLVENYNLLNWSLNGNDVRQHTSFGTTDNFDIRFIRNAISYLILNINEIQFLKKVNMNNQSLANLVDPRFERRYKFKWI